MLGSVVNSYLHLKQVELLSYSIKYLSKGVLYKMQLLVLIVLGSVLATTANSDVFPYAVIQRNNWSALRSSGVDGCTVDTGQKF